MLRVGVVGCGKIADAHVTQARATGRATVVAVCDREPLMAEQLATRLEVPARYTDLAAMLEKERLDVLHIATPPDSHVAIGCEAMRAGCHVFVEKPFALDASKASTLLDCAARTHRHITVNYLYNFEWPALELHRLLARGALGDIVHLDTAYGYNLSGDYGLAVLADPNHWVHGLPGKLFHNVLDHVFAKVAAFVSQHADVHAVAFRRRQATGNALVDAMPDELRFTICDAGVTVSGMVSAHGRPVAHTLRVIGSRDTVDLDYSARTLVFTARQSQPSALGRLFPPWVQAGRFMKNGWRNLGQFRRHEFQYFHPMRVLLDGFYAAVQGRAPEPISREHILRVSTLIDRVVVALAAPRERAA
jgi:predicted dehydrogenase